MATSGDNLHDAFEKASVARKRGRLKPINIFSPERRKIDEDTVADLVQTLRRDGRFFYPILVRQEGTNEYRLIAGSHRLDAWKCCFGEEWPIPAIVYPPETPDAVINVYEIEENLLRKELTAAEREAQTLRFAAAFMRLDSEKPATESPLSGSDAKSATSGGRGKKAATARLADRTGLSKVGMQRRIKAASVRSVRRSTSIAIRPRNWSARRTSASRPNPSRTQGRAAEAQQARASGAIEDPTRPVLMGLAQRDETRTLAPTGAANLLRTPQYIFLPAILLIASIEVFGVNNNIVDLYILILVIGYILRKLVFSLAPLVIGLVLGPMIDIRRPRLAAREPAARHPPLERSG